VRDSLNNYIDHHKFKEFSDNTSAEFENSRVSMEHLKNEQKNFGDEINKIDKKATDAKDEVNQNSQMIKEINFSDMT